MLAAHLVPGYFAAVKSQSHWRPEWGKKQRVLLWIAALASTVLPDLDVIYNALFRGFFNHSTLWTHSLFVHLSIGLCWWLLRRIGRWPYVQMFTGLVTVGGLSHLVLDVVSHSTPLLYPVSLFMFGIVPGRILEGGIWAYITDPLFLIEPFLLMLAGLHWIFNRRLASRVKSWMVIGIIGCWILFSGMFVLLLPWLQSIVRIKVAG